MNRCPRFRARCSSAGRSRSTCAAIVATDAEGDRDALLDYLVSDEALDWESIHDPRYAERHTCAPLLDTDTCDGRDVTDHWIVYGAFGRQNNHQVFASKRLVIQPGVRYQLQDPVGSDLIVVQGMGRSERISRARRGR